MFGFHRKAKTQTASAKSGKKRGGNDNTPRSNFGKLSVNTAGNSSVGIGGGLSIDMSDGGTGIQIGGITFKM